MFRYPFQHRCKSIAYSVKSKLLSMAINPTPSTLSQSPIIHRYVGYWLLGMSASVAGMVAVGGVTRLTKSGLSMTDWKLQGSLPPQNLAQWQAEFDRYKTFPEWQQRQRMTLEEFKYIYFWEWGHRMLGRSLGLLFVGPFAYFSLRGMIPRTLYPRMGLLFGLGGTQGLIGWWMVKSGLNVDPAQKKEIRVSPYRLATHLGLAFTTYSACLWSGLDILNSSTQQMSTAKSLPPAALSAAKTLRRFSVINMCLVGTTVISGAFVAGNDAGRAYNTFPLMGDQFIPDGILEMDPLWRNIFENTATVQFDHRVLALSTLASVGYMYYTGVRGATFRTLPALSRGLLHGVAGMAVTQVTLGIATLLLYVPISLGVTHQVYLRLCIQSFSCIYSYYFHCLCRSDRWRC